MRYALLGDIHSSLHDLTAVLHHISTEAPAAEVIGIGDLYECTVSKKNLHGQVYECVEDVIKHPDELDTLLTFPSIYGNQEERILLLTKQAEPLREFIRSLPETLRAGNATVIHGHQWKPEDRSNWVDEHLPEAAVIIHGHTHRSSYTQDEQLIVIQGDSEISLTGKRHIINVGAVVHSKEWLLYDDDKQTVRFMKA